MKSHRATPTKAEFLFPAFMVGKPLPTVAEQGGTERGSRRAHRLEGRLFVKKHSFIPVVHLVFARIPSQYLEERGKVVQDER